MELNSTLDLAQAIANRLDGYVPQESRCLGVNIVLEHESNDGRQIWINTQDAKKYKAGCTWPRHKNIWYSPDGEYSTTATKTRGPTGIAYEINHRLLPDYHEEYPKQLAKMQVWVEHEDVELATRTEILEAIDPGRPLPNHLSECMQIPVYASSIRKIRVSGTSVMLETCSLPKEVALEVIALLQSKNLE